MSNHRTTAIYMDARQHALTVQDLYDVAAWLRNMDCEPRVGGQHVLSHGIATVSARLADLADHLTAYEESHAADALNTEPCDVCGHTTCANECYEAHS